MAAIVATVTRLGMNLFIFSPLCSVIEGISFSFDFHDFRLNRRSSYFSPHLGCSKALYAPGVGDAEGHHQEVEGVGGLEPQVLSSKGHRNRGISSASTSPPKEGDRYPESPPGLCEKWDNPVSGTD